MIKNIKQHLRIGNAYCANATQCALRDVCERGQGIGNPNVFFLIYFVFSSSKFFQSPGVVAVLGFWVLCKGD